MLANKIRFCRFVLALLGFGLLMHFAPEARAAAPTVQAITKLSLPPSDWRLIMVGAKDVSVQWALTFSQPVSGVSKNSFRLVAKNISASLGITGLSGTGDAYTVTVNVPRGKIDPDSLARLRLDFVDDDTVIAVADGSPVGGVGLGNGDFIGEAYTLGGTACGRDRIIWCDDFERSVTATNKKDLVGNRWEVSGDGGCSHEPASYARPDAGGCAGIDSDIKPYKGNYDSRERAHPTGRTMFNRWYAHTVTSRQINLSLYGKNQVVELSYWLRRGDDSFASAPDGRDSHMFVEFMNRYGKWIRLAHYRSSGTHGQAGQAVRPTIQLPDDALWGGFRVRFRQQSGRGTGDRGHAGKVNGYDYWFVDDVVLTHSGIGAQKAYCDNFELPEVSRKFWSFTSEDFATGAKFGGERIGDGGITGDVHLRLGSPTHSMFLRWSYITASSPHIDTTGNYGYVSFVMQRGMKNAPSRINGAPVVTSCDQTMAEPGNRFVAEYWGADSAWHRLVEVDGASGESKCGELFSLYFGPLNKLSQARHQNFRLRFRQVSTGAFQDNVNDHYDYWLVDDVCIGTPDIILPAIDLMLTKTQEGSFRAGEIARYLLKVKNNGGGQMSGYIEVTDVLPSVLSFISYSGTGWDCRNEGQTVTCGWTGSVATGGDAPDLHLYVMVSDKASGVVTNTASIKSTGVIDPVPLNNSSVSKAQVESTNFAFTKGACQDGQKVGAASSPSTCSYYRFDGLAGELKNNIHITQMDKDGKFAQEASSDLSATLEFALRCIDPPGPPAKDSVFATFGGSKPLRLNVCAREDAKTLNWNTADTLSVTIPGGRTSVGALNFFYEDVGRLELLMRVVGEEDKQVSSGEFVQKPAALALKDVSCADGTVNPAPTAANGARFCRAGQAFGMTVEAQSVDGNATPNFGNEKTGKAIFLEKSVLLPANGNDPAFAVPGFARFTKGAASTTAQVWTEVGILAVRPRLGDEKTDGSIALSKDYLGAGDIPVAQPVNIGRFYPDRFQTEIGDAGRMGCPPGLSCPPGGFFYAGQPFALTVKACAYNDGTCGARLRNYRGAFAPGVDLSAWAVRGSTAVADENPPDVATNGGHLNPMPGQGLSAAVIPAGSFVGPDGDGGLFSADFRYQYTLLSRPVGQTDIYIRAAENGHDKVTSRFAAAPDNSSEAGITVARGRIKLANRFGTGKANLEIPVQVQFWHCSGIQCAWVSSSTDETRIGPGTPLLDAAKRAALSVSLHPVPGGGAMTSPPTVERFELLDGLGKIVLKPGSDTGSVNVSINLGAGTEDNACGHAKGYKEGAASNIPWLRAWNGVCTQAQSGAADPAARASIGIYSGDTHRAVHNREVF
ncbi:MAG: DUF11 domain-containing protein [Azoarcus sp.]|jgi:uncharacterized repeat protein (TIGR01451 family)|nr:DUF11 domain-containing protein [Azoarcus sp.]